MRSGSRLDRKYVEEQTVILSAAQIPLRIGKGYNGFTQGGAIPAIANYKRLGNIERIKKAARKKHEDPSNITPKVICDKIVLS